MPSERTLDATEVDFLASEWTLDATKVDFILPLEWTLDGDLETEVDFVPQERTLECDLKTEVDFVPRGADFEMRPKSTLCRVEWTLEMRLE